MATLHLVALLPALAAGLPVVAPAPSPGALRGAGSLPPSQEAAEIISSMVSAFMNTSAMQESERTCIVQRVGDLAEEMVGLMNNSISLLSQIVGSEDASANAQSMPPSQLVPRIRASVTRMMALQIELTQSCIRGDVLEQLDVASRHMRDLSYIGGRLLANGADILYEVTSATVAWRDRHFQEFGRFMGIALRKVLLSPSDTPGNGPPSAFALQRMSIGLVQGFFGDGFGLTITSQAAHLNLQVNLHRCIGENVDFFQSAWAATWVFLDGLSRNPAEIAAHPQAAGSNQEMALAEALVLLPGALRRCNISSDQESMLLDSLKALNTPHVDFHAPNEGMGNGEVSVSLAKSVRDWSNGRWEEFGFDLGRLLQQMVIVMFPRAYHVYGGRLRKELIGAYEAKDWDVADGSWTVPALSVSICLLLVAALTLKARKHLAGWRLAQYNDVGRPDQPEE